MSSQNHQSSRSRIFRAHWAQIQCSDERTFSVTSPSAGAIFELGRAIEIRWTVAGRNKVSDWTEQAVTIQLMSGGSSPGEGLVVKQIVSHTINTGQYTWYPQVGDDSLLGSKFSISVFPIDRQISDATAGIVRFRSACPAESLKLSKCASGLFSIAHKSAMPMQIRIKDIHAERVDASDFDATSSNTPSDSETAETTSVSAFVIGKSYPVTWESVRREPLIYCCIRYPRYFQCNSRPHQCFKCHFYNTCLRSVSERTLMLELPSTVEPSYPLASFFIKATVVRASDGVAEGSSATTDPFRVSAPESILINAPANPGKRLVKGSTYNVQWTYTGVPFDVDIFLYRGSRKSPPNIEFE